MCLVAVEDLLRLRFLTQRVAGKDEVFLPRESGTDAEHCRSDRGQLWVQLVLAQLATENQIGLQCCDGLEIEIVGRTHIRDTHQLVGEVRRLARRAFRAGHAYRGDSERKYFVQFAAVEDDDARRLGVEGGLAQCVLDGAREFPGCSVTAELRRFRVGGAEQLAAGRDVGISVRVATGVGSSAGGCGKNSRQGDHGDADRTSVPERRA